MHTLYFQAMITALKHRCHAITGSPVTISADCIWFDARPQAHLLDGSGVKPNVGLADLLADVSVIPRQGRRSAWQARLTYRLWAAGTDGAAAAGVPAAMPTETRSRSSAQRSPTMVASTACRPAEHVRQAPVDVRTVQLTGVLVHGTRQRRHGRHACGSTA
jgi:hypothetical protein